VPHRVRIADQTDAEDLARVHLRSWRWAYRGLLPDAYLARLRFDALAGRWFMRLADPDAETQVRVLERRGRVEGFITFGPQRDDPTWLGHAGEVHMLYLEPSLVGRGYGAALLDRARAELAERARCFWLVLWVLARNERARRFYEEQGLVTDGGHRWDPFGAQAVPVLRYAQALNPVVDFEAIRDLSVAGRREK
jgi:GNAT superfamily N-acetyltransferase